VNHSLVTTDSFGGATPVNLAQLQGVGTQPAYTVDVSLYSGSYALGILEGGEIGSQRQWAVVDTLGALRGNHNFKFGIDWRRLTPTVNPGSPYVSYLYFSDASVAANSVDYGFAESSTAFYPVYADFSAFIQDEWHATPHLNVSLGLRWEINPAPGAARGLMPYPWPVPQRLCQAAYHDSAVARRRRQWRPVSSLHYEMNRV
jgi:outer membrane receptor protein involved in Fe transport